MPRLRKDGQNTTAFSTSTYNFDTNILGYDSTSTRNPEEKVIPYHYFGTRLVDLYEELMNPTPTWRSGCYNSRLTGVLYLQILV